MIDHHRSLETLSVVSDERETMAVSHTSIAETAGPYSSDPPALLHTLGYPSPLLPPPPPPQLFSFPLPPPPPPPHCLWAFPSPSPGQYSFYVPVDEAFTTPRARAMCDIPLSCRVFHLSFTCRVRSGTPHSSCFALFFFPPELLGERRNCAITARAFRCFHECNEG